MVSLEPIGSYASDPFAAQDEPLECEWRQSEEDVWETACGEGWLFEKGTPADIRFCPFCGRHLIVSTGRWRAVI